MQLFRLVCLGLVFVFSVYTYAAEREAVDYPTPYTGRSDVNTYLDELVAEHGFSRAWLDAAFAQAEQRQDII